MKVQKSLERLFDSHKHCSFPWDITPSGRDIFYPIYYIIYTGTSLLQAAQASEQCIKALSTAQAAEERVLSGVGSVSRLSSPPKQYPVSFL